MVTQTIYEMLLQFLHITQTPDADSVSRIQNEAASGIRYIQRYCDPEATCEPGTDYSDLLCEYVLRAEGGALATFEDDFAQDIVQAKIITDTKMYAEAMGYDQE